MDLPPKTSQLCRSCEALSFDDRLTGGKRRVEDGRIFLDVERGKDYWAETVEIPLPCEIVDTFPGLPSLAKSAASGCECCKFLRDALLLEMDDDRDSELRITFFAYFGSIDRYEHYDPRGLQAIRANVHFYDTKGVPEAPLGFLGGDFHSEHDIWFMVASGQGNCGPWLNLSMAPHPDSLCSENVQLLREDLAEAQLSSTRDSLPPSGRRYQPTRLVDLRDAQRPRLVECNSNRSVKDPDDGDLKYAALSYCWGTKEVATSMLKTTSATLGSMLNEIPIGAMPAVSQDAIRVCAALSIRFLWIDALCILQDSPADWEREAASVGATYKNATITIVPLLSENHSQGFLQRSLSCVEIPFLSMIDSEVHGTFSLLHATPSSRSFHGKFRGWVTFEVESSLWNTRGWTFQEHRLSQNVIHFGRYVSFFFSRSMKSIRLGTQGPRVSSEWLELQMGDSAHDGAWPHLMRIFSLKDLTYPKDRLPAVSSIASAYAIANDDRYLAGIWYKKLHRQLLWVSFEAQNFQTLMSELLPPAAYVAPSWSWASYRKQVYFPDPRIMTSLLYITEIRELDILVTDIELDGNDPYGKIHSASLTVSGKLAPLPQQLAIDIPSGPRKSTSVAFITDGEYVLAECHFDWVQDVEDAWISPVMGIELLLILSFQDTSPSEFFVSVECQANGLILLPTEQDNEYRRVGVFEMYPDQDWTPENHWESKLFAGREKRTIKLI